LGDTGRSGQDTSGRCRRSNPAAARSFLSPRARQKWNAAADFALAPLTPRG